MGFQRNLFCVLETLFITLSTTLTNSSLAGDIVLTGRVFDKQGNPATITTAIFTSSSVSVSILAEHTPLGSFRFVIRVPNDAPVLFACNGESTDANGSKLRLHWAVIERLASISGPGAHVDAQGRLLYNVDLVLFRRDGPFEIEPIMGQLLTYERLFYLRSLEGAKVDQIRDEFAAYLLEIPSPDGPRKDLFSNHTLLQQGLSSHQAEAVRAKRDQVLELYGLGEAQRGALIEDIVQRSPAERLGLKRGDILLKINNVELRDARDLSRGIRMTAGHDTLILVRDVRTGADRQLRTRHQGKLGIGFSIVGSGG